MRFSTLLTVCWEFASHELSSQTPRWIHQKRPPALRGPILCRLDQKALKQSKPIMVYRLVVVGHPSEKYEFVNWNDNRNPILVGKVKKWQPNHQPVVYR